MKLRTKLSLMLALLTGISLFFKMTIFGLSFNGNGGGP